MGYIYIVINKINGKSYVGQTMAPDIQKRWSSYRNLRKTQIGECFYNGLNKYKPENFKFEIICICFDEDCNRYEEFYIKKFNTLVPNGYNLREGGKNSKQHPESIEKRRLAIIGRPRKEEFILRGKDNPNFGKKYSQEEKNKLSKSYTPEQRKIQSLVMKERWKNCNIEKQLESLKLGHEKIKKKVSQYSLDNELIATFESASEAAINTNNISQSISKCCHGKYKQSKGFIWKFV